MAELETKEQVMAYLAQMSPTETFHAYRIPHGWVCTKALPPEEMNSGAMVGLARLVLDSETGIIYQYPSWSADMVAEAHAEFKRTGISRGASQVYPYQSRIMIRRTSEDQHRVTYHMTVESLTDPPEPTQEHPLIIHKHSHRTEPTDYLSAVARSHATWCKDRNNGVWPEVDMTEF